MEIIRTKLNVPPADWLTTGVKTVQNAFNLTVAASSDTAVSLKVSDAIQLEFTKTESDYCVMNVVDVMHNWKSTILRSSNSAFNIQIFKFSDKCGGIAVNRSTSAYTPMANFFIDTTNGEESSAVFIPNVGTASAYESIFADGKIDSEIKAFVPCFPWERTDVPASRSDYQVAWLTDLVNVRTAVTFDNLKVVITTPGIVSKPVIVNGKKYYFTNGIAIPCGDGDIKYTTV